MVKSLDFIKDSNKNYEKKDKVIIGNNGKEYRVKIASNIKDSVVMDIVDELLRRSEMCKKENVKLDMVMTIYSLLLKNLTDIEFSQYSSVKKQVSHELDMLKAMIDLQVLEPILNEFDMNEINKIKNAFLKYSETFKKINNNLISKSLKEDEID